MGGSGMSESDTPRTDAEAGYYDGSGCWHHRANGENVDSDFARTLERELTAARAELETYRDSCAAKADRIDRLGEQAVKLRAEVEALRAALKLCAAVCAGETTTKAELIAALEAARAALAKEKA